MARSRLARTAIMLGAAAWLFLHAGPAAGAPDAGFMGKVLQDDFFGNRAPVAGATARAFPLSVTLASEIDATSLSDGSYTLAGLEGGVPYDLIISAPGLAELQVKGVTTTAAAVTPLDLVMNGGSGLYGRVTDSLGAPVSGASLEAYRNNINNSGAAQSFATSGPDGSYRFDNLPLGVWFVRARKTGFAYASASALTLSASPLRVYRNLGGGGEQYTEAWHAPFLDPIIAAEWKDLDADGNTDIAVSLLGGGSRAYRNLGGFNFVMVTWTASATNNTTLISYDFDGNGACDMMLGGISEPLMVLQNKWFYSCGYFYYPGGFNMIWKSPFDDYLVALSRADVNADGNEDVLAGTFTQLSPTVNLALGPGGSLGGSIRDALWGFGVAGASLDVENGGATFMMGSAGSDGSYLFPNLEPSAYTVTVSAPAYLSCGASAVWVNDLAATTRDFYLTPTGQVLGTLRDAAGLPLAGAQVKVIPLGLTASSAANGSFQFGLLPPGTFTLLAVWPGWPQVGKDFSITSSVPAAVNLTFSAGASGLEGTLRARGDSSPVSGGRIVASQTDGSGYQTASSGADGSWVMAGLAAGTYFLSLSAAGFRPATATATAPQGGRGEVSLYLERNRALPDLSKARVFPNPARLSQCVRHTIKFAGLPAGCGITLYNTAGEQVRGMPPGFYSGLTVNDGVSGMAEWAGTNDLDQPVARGLYFYRITSPEGQEARGKLVLLK